MISFVPRAVLRVCASCEWIFDFHKNAGTGCPMCRFGSYGAHYVYGQRCYTYARTQQPWRDKQLTKRSIELDDIIRTSQRL